MESLQSDYEAQLSAAFSSPPLMFPSTRAPSEPPTLAPPTPKTPQTPSKEPPACVQNAMNRERKPFTYTPGGLDLSQIRSEKMARRLMRNAMSPGVQERTPPTPTPATPDTPKAASHFYNMPVAVFPQIKIPANPMRLLRRTSGPFSRESVDRSLEPVSTSPARETTINGLANETAKIASEIDQALKEMISESKAKTENEARKQSEAILEQPSKQTVPETIESNETIVQLPLEKITTPEELYIPTTVTEIPKIKENDVLISEESKPSVDRDNSIKNEPNIVEEVTLKCFSPKLPSKTIEEIKDPAVEEKIDLCSNKEFVSNSDDVAIEATIKIVCDNVLNDTNISSELEKCASPNEDRSNEKLAEMENNTRVEDVEINIEVNNEDDGVKELREQSIEVTLNLPRSLSPRNCASPSLREKSVDRLTLPRSASPIQFDSNRENSIDRSINLSRSSLSPTRMIYSPNIQEQNSETVTITLPSANSPCKIVTPVISEPETYESDYNSTKAEEHQIEVSVKLDSKSPLDIIRALSPQPFSRERSVERGYSPVKFTSPLLENSESVSPVVMRDKRISSPNRRLDGLKTLSSDLDSMPTLNICTKRFSFLRETPDKDCFDMYAKPPPKISLIDKPNTEEKTPKTHASMLSNDDLLKEAIEINRRSTTKNTTSKPAEVLPPWEYDEAAHPFGIERAIFSPPPQPDATRLATPALAPGTKWKHSFIPQTKPLGFLPGTGSQPTAKSEEKPKPQIWNPPKEIPKPVNADEIDSKEPPWRRELREMAIKRQEINDEIEARAQVEHPWRKELRELHQTKGVPNDTQSIPAERPQCLSPLGTYNTTRDNSVTSPILNKYIPSQTANSLTAESNSTSQYASSESVATNTSQHLWNQHPNDTNQQNNYVSTFSTPKQNYSQTLRPKSWMERKADLCREREVIVPEWTKSATLKRNAFSKNTSDYSSGGSSPGKEVRSTPEITIEIAGQPSSNKISLSNGYSYPWASSPDSSLAFSPEPTQSDRTPTPQSRSSPCRQYVPYSSSYYTPVVRREYGTLSYEPNKRHQVRSCPIQSRSFKYLQLLTGTEDTYEDDEPFILQPPQHAHLRPENL